MLMTRYEPLEVEYQVATVFSLGMMISAYEFEFKNDEYYATVINALDNINMSAEKVGEIPSLIFMLPSFMTEETSEMVAQVVEQLSATYFVVMRERLDL